MEAVVAAVRPKQQGTFTQDFRPYAYDILLTESTVPNTDRVIKHLPKTRLPFDEEAADSLCIFLHNLTGADLGGLKGKRAVFVPAAENDCLIKGTLYCVPIDGRDKLHAQYVDNLPGSPGFYSFDQVLETLSTNQEAYSRQTCSMLIRLQSWLKDKHGVPGAINLLFSACTEDRLKRSITNPAYFTESHLAYLSGTESCELAEGYSRAIANEALAKMMEIEKCDIIKFNTMFGQEMPFKSKVDAYAVNKYWGLGRPDYSKMTVPQSGAQGRRNTLPGINSSNWVEEFPLHKCAFEGDADGIRTLIKAGHKVTKVDRDSWAPIHYAAWFGHLEAIQVLLTEGSCSPNIPNDNGSTPLHLAASKGRCYVIELLLNHKDIDVNALNNYNKTALSLCENVDKPDWQSAAQLLRNAMSRPTPTIQVSLMDGTYRMLNLVSGANTTVQQLHQQMMKELNIPEACGNIFTIWICSRNLQLQLKPEHKPIQHLNDWKRKIVTLLTTWDPSREDPQLFWRRHASLNMDSEKRVRNPVAIRLLFHEAYHNYIMSFYPCSNQDAVILGGILLQLHHGDYDQRKSRNILSGDRALKPLIPTSKLRDRGQNWSKELIAQYKEFSQRMVTRDRSPQVLQQQFLRICWNLTVYGSAFFTGHVQIRNNPTPTQVYIGVNDIGIHIIVVQTKNMLQTFNYDGIDWQHQKENEVLVVRLKGPTKGGMHIKTRQAGLVKHLMDKLSQLNSAAPPISQA